MTGSSQQLRWHGFADVAELQADALLRIRAAASSAVGARGVFRIVLAGGNTPRAIYQALARAITDWSKWQVYFGDERCLPVNDPQRNSRMARDTLLDHVPIPRTNIHVIPAEAGPIEGAAQYAQTLRAVGEFDMVLLGLGEDGHTASLFPDHDWGVSPDAHDALAVFDAPKPPPERISLSAARLSRARCVLFLVEGEGKREAIARWRNGDPIPASVIMPASGVEVLTVSGLL
ncbi:MAG TPA: 6-phosphogluconolactonase [Rhodanobacteraceae bacterium]|jgi:6-phosphogluconolactonase|nr:6-phosphogluconolactonase [Rhodanobacteraceae bacterium]